MPDDEALTIAARAAFSQFLRGNVTRWRNREAVHAWDTAQPQVRADFIAEQRAAFKALDAAGYHLTR